jgi:cytochrome c oxidase cbb3-type subunit III
VSRGGPAVLALVALAVGAGAQEPPSGPSRATPIPQRGAVGPVPGVGEPPPRENPIGDDPTVLANGRNLFVGMNCAGCHGEHGGGGMGPSLRDAAWIYGGDAGSIFDSIAQGRANGMPAWGTLLPEQLIWNITAYVQALRTDQEPDPPR